MVGSLKALGAVHTLPMSLVEESEAAWQLFYLLFNYSPSSKDGNTFQYPQATIDKDSEDMAEGERRRNCQSRCRLQWERQQVAYVKARLMNK